MTTFKRLRREYHKAIFRELLAYRENSKVLNIADGTSKPSVDLARRMAAKIGLKPAKKAKSPQTIGQRFAELTREFIEAAFAHLQHLRPGQWVYSTSHASSGIAAFDQYEHLARVQEVLNKNPEMKAALGGDYLITPDIIVARKPEPDATINSREQVVGPEEQVASLAPFRAGNVPDSPAILHASVSCKWTMRSDRAQNTRTEALNLIRNRKGNTPHIVAVTFEPSPGRLASIAMGTGDIDCTYHVALHELCEATEESKHHALAELLHQLIAGRRLRDRSDLPLHLAV